jgi:hypothetical protein
LPPKGVVALAGGFFDRTAVDELDEAAAVTNYAGGLQNARVASEY